MGLYNVVVEIDGFEVLIFDGSLVLFVWKIVEIGLKILNVFLCVIKVLEYVEVIDDEVKVLFLFVQNFQIVFYIDFFDFVIG